MKPASEWKIPEYLEGMPDSTLIKSSEIVDIFGCHITQTTRIKDIPAPEVRKTDLPKNGMHFGFGGRAYYWKLGTIRKWIREHQ